MLKVGFARVVITPQESVPLAGYGNTSRRMMQNVLDDICATCVAITDERGETAVIIGTDTTRAYYSMVHTGQTDVAWAIGVKPEQVVLCATHSHSAPDLLNNAEPSIGRYKAYLMPKLVEAAQLAMADRKTAKLLVGSVEATGLNFVRHYKAEHMETGEISYLGNNFGESPQKRVLCHASEADPTMHLARFVREGGKDVVIANWRAHATMTGGSRKGDLSADYIGPFRNVLEAQQDCHVLYLQGACGCINPSSRIESEMYTKDHRVMGARLAYFAVQGLEHHMKEADDGHVHSKRFVLHGKVNHTLDHLAKTARKISDDWEATGDTAAANRAGEPYGIRSPYHACAIADRSVAPETFDLELNAISIGKDFALVGAPNELFHFNSMHTEEHSPFATTMTMGYCNGHWYYMPDHFAFSYSCYESDITPFLEGTAEEISDTHIAMLQELKGR